MKFQAAIRNNKISNTAVVGINGEMKEIPIPGKSSGNGSSVSGGELLLLSLATCFCNDLYREATRRNITISEIKVNVTCDFFSEGEAGSNFKYSAEIKSDEPPDVIRNLIEFTDSVAEIHKTLRKGAEVVLIS